MSIISAGDTGGLDLPEISNSLRFYNSGLNRTFASSNRLKWTWSAWAKRGSLGAQSLHSAVISAGSTEEVFGFNANDQLYYHDGAVGLQTQSIGNWRDPSAWYHIVFVYDSANTTQANRGIFYVNGVQLANSTNAIGSSRNSYINAAVNNSIGKLVSIGGFTFDGYLSNVCFIDGQAKTPSDFAYTDPNGQWRSLSKTALQSVVNAGGANSFFLSFDNGSSTTTLGNDASSKGNNWTAVSMVRDGSASDCWSYDTPTNNFATLSWIDNGCQILNGALSWYSSGAAWQGCRATQAVPASKVIWEVTVGSSYTQIAVGPRTASLGLGTGDTGVYRWDASGGVITHSGVTQTTITLAINDVVGVAVDGAAGTVALYKNGALAYTFSQTFSGDVYPSVWMYQTTQSHINFGQRTVASGQWYPDAGGYFRYAPPTGYKALSTKNLPGGAVTTSGTFTGNVAVAGPFVWINGTPTAMTINGNAVTFGTHADKLANGFKLRTSSTSYNNSGSNTYSVTSNSGVFKYNNAEGNP